MEIRSTQGEIIEYRQWSVGYVDDVLTPTSPTCHHSSHTHNRGVRLVTTCKPLHLIKHPILNIMLSVSPHVEQDTFINAWVFPSFQEGGDKGKVVKMFPRLTKEWIYMRVGL